MDYTKGEWKAKQVTGELGTMDYVDIPGYAIKLETTKADAHLIAAAPMLYEALRAIYSEPTRLTPAELALVGIALAKAEAKNA